MQQLLVIFDSEISDAIFDESGEVVTPGGQSLAITLAQALREHGFRVNEVVQRSFYGWEFEISTGKHRFLAVLQQAESWLIAVGDTSHLFARLTSRSSAHELDRVAHALSDAVVATKSGTNVRIECPWGRG